MRDPHPRTLLREEEESLVRCCVGGYQFYPFASQTRTKETIPPAAATPSLQLGSSAVCGGWGGGLVLATCL